MQMKGEVPVNDDVGLEKEADVMGARAVQTYVSSFSTPDLQTKLSSSDRLSKGIVQRKSDFVQQAIILIFIELMKIHDLDQYDELKLNFEQEVSRLDKKDKDDSLFKKFALNYLAIFERAYKFYKQYYDRHGDVYGIKKEDSLSGKMGKSRDKAWRCTFQTELDSVRELGLVWEIDPIAQTIKALFINAELRKTGKAEHIPRAADLQQNENKKGNLAVFTQTLDIMIKEEIIEADQRDSLLKLYDKKVLSNEDLDADKYYMGNEEGKVRELIKQLAGNKQ
jgi:hypothetical protein